MAGTGLNDQQKAAVRRVAAAQDYSLLLGMPGTGKTTTVAAIVRVLARLGKRVLVTAYTNSAVDSVLLKLMDLEVDFVRLSTSASAKTHPRLAPHILHPASATSAAALSNKVSAARVIATTCLSAGSAALRGQDFDVCIVDEASQVTQPVCLAPLKLAKAFLLVGDHKQLPPLVVSADARALGFDNSLFKRLADAHPPAVISLTRQYRMQLEVMGLANELVYEDRLICGSAAVACRALFASSQSQALAAWAGSGAAHRGVGRWMGEALAAERAVVFIDTGKVSICARAAEGVPAEGGKRGGEGCNKNSGEALVVGLLVDALRKCGVVNGDIGVISPYRAQVTNRARI